MARKKKEDLYIQRATPATIEMAIRDKGKGVYYFTEGEDYIVWDLRGSKPFMTKYGSVEEVMEKVN